MEEYKVLYTETVVHEFYVEANSVDEAKKEFKRMRQEGLLDFSDGEVVDIEREILVDEGTCKYVSF